MSIIRPDFGLSYDDVLLVPKRTHVNSRKQIDTKTMLTKNLIMNIPIISANMDTVTESTMAATIARYGGIGIIHRFLSIDEQVNEVLRVKRSDSIIIEHPYVMEPTKKVGEVLRFMKDHGITGIPVVSEDKLVGMLTHRDIMFEDNHGLLVQDVMTKQQDLITAKYGINLEDAKEILKKHRIEKLPLVDEEGRLKGLVTSKDILKIKQFPNAFKDIKGRLRVGAAIGVKKEDMDRAIALHKADVDVIVIDVAHGHSDFAINMTKRVVKELGDIEIIAGNVCTKEGTEDLISAGATCIKAGVGPGSFCTTRIVTGCGMPQLSAVMECSAAAERHGTPIIADGGIKNSGDIVKALAAGASSVMIGNMFTGTDESPGIAIYRNGRRSKLGRGSSSLGVNIARRNMSHEEFDFSEIVPEGVEAVAEYKGSVTDIIKQLVGGIRSGMSYCGAEKISDMRRNAEFIRITPAGMRESKPHDIDMIR